MREMRRGEEGGREQTGWRKEGWMEGRTKRRCFPFVRETFLFTGSHILYLEIFAHGKVLYNLCAARFPDHKPQE